jgi:transposase
VIQKILLQKQEDPMKAGLVVRRDISATVLRKKARGEKNGRVSSRLFGIANILDGMSREQAATQAGMTRQTLRDWVLRSNEHGAEGLKDRCVGPECKLTPEQEKEIETLVLRGPEGTLVRWRRVDLQKEIEKRYGVTCHERTISKLLQRPGFSHISVRPRNPKADTAAQEDFKKTLRRRLLQFSPPVPGTKPSSSGSRTKLVSGKKAP